MPDKASYVIRIVLSACILFLFMQGCRNQQQDRPEADDLGARKEFSIGISPELNLFRQRARYEPLAGYLSQKLGVEIELQMVDSYHGLLENIQAGELDAAFLGSFAGAVAMKKLGAKPLARVQYPDGTSTYRGLLFTRKDSGIASVQDMKGKTMVLVDKATTAGWLHPLHYFKENRIDDPFSWLGEIYFAGTHEDAILDVVNRKADVGAAKDTVFYHLAQSDKRLDRLTVLATSPPVPANTLMVNRETDEATAKSLQAALLSMHENHEGRQVLEKLGVAKFIETAAKDYDTVFAYADEAGIDVSNHQKSDHQVKKEE